MKITIYARMVGGIASHVNSYVDILKKNHSIDVISQKDLSVIELAKGYFYVDKSNGLDILKEKMKDTDVLHVHEVATSTEFMLPYCSLDPVKPGMDEAALLDLAWTSHRGTSQLTDGAIAVEKEFEFDNIDYTQDITCSFMDHKIIIKNFEDNDPQDDKIDIDVLYVGNMNEAVPAMETVTIWEDSFGPGYEFYFNRENEMVWFCLACYSLDPGGIFYKACVKHS